LLICRSPWWRHEDGKGGFWHCVWDLTIDGASSASGRYSVDSHSRRAAAPSWPLSTLLQPPCERAIREALPQLSATVHINSNPSGSVPDVGYDGCALRLRSELGGEEPYVILHFRSRVLFAILEDLFVFSFFTYRSSLYLHRHNISSVSRSFVTSLC
jgi:hypothetical protein